MHLFRFISSSLAYFVHSFRHSTMFMRSYANYLRSLIEYKTYKFFKYLRDVIFRVSNERLRRRLKKQKKRRIKCKSRLQTINTKLVLSANKSLVLMQEATKKKVKFRTQSKTGDPPLPEAHLGLFDISEFTLSTIQCTRILKPMQVSQQCQLVSCCFSN